MRLPCNKSDDCMTWRTIDLFTTIQVFVYGCEHGIAFLCVYVGYCRVTAPLTSKRVSNIPKYGSGANACIYWCLRTQEEGEG